MNPLRSDNPRNLWKKEMGVANQWNTLFLFWILSFLKRSALPLNMNVIFLHCHLTWRYYIKHIYKKVDWPWMCFWNQTSVRATSKDKQHNITKPTSKKSTHISYSSHHKWSTRFPFLYLHILLIKVMRKTKIIDTFDLFTPNIFMIYKSFLYYPVPKNWSQSNLETFPDYNLLWEQELYLVYICLCLVHNG